jgi:fibronectin type 3 domain-containing protein
LASVTGTTESAAWAINDVGTIVGHVYSDPTAYGSFREAVVWQGDTVGKLAPPTFGARTFARAIDNFGRVAVSWTTGAEYNGDWHAARWTPTVPNGTTGTMTTLGVWGSAYDINDSGVVSGNEGSYGYLWDGTTAADLWTPYWGHVSVYGVNNAGAAVGSTEDSDNWITTALVWDQGNYGRDLNLLLTAYTPIAYPGSLYSAIAINGSGQIVAQGANSGVVLLTPSSEPPAPQEPAPPGWIVANPENGSVRLNWDAPYFAESYHVKRSTASGGPYTTIATNVALNGFSDTDVINGTTYYYVVSSVNGSYESADSIESAATAFRDLPEAPTSVSAQGGDATVYLQWSEGLYATSYNVKRSTVNGGPYTTIATGVQNGYMDSSVVNGTRYYYVVSSVNGNGESANSVAAATAIPLAPPAAPTNLSGTMAKGNKGVKLTWTQSASPEIGSNAVYRSTNGGAYVRLTGFLPTTTYTDTTIRTGTTYSYVVTAVNVNAASSPYSNAVTARAK